MGRLNEQEEGRGVNDRQQGAACSERRRSCSSRSWQQPSSIAAAAAIKERSTQNTLPTRTRDTLHWITCLLDLLQAEPPGEALSPGATLSPEKLSCSSAHFTRLIQCNATSKFPSQNTSLAGRCKVGTTKRK